MNTAKLLKLIEGTNRVLHTTLQKQLEPVEEDGGMAIDGHITSWGVPLLCYHLDGRGEHTVTFMDEQVWSSRLDGGDFEDDEEEAAALLRRCWHIARRVALTQEVFDKLAGDEAL